MTAQWLTDLRSRADGGDAVAAMLVEHIHGLMQETVQLRGSLANSRGATERLRIEMEQARLRVIECENRVFHAETRESAAVVMLADADALIERCEAEIDVGARATLDLVRAWLDERDPMRKTQRGG